MEPGTPPRIAAAAARTPSSPGSPVGDASSVSASTAEAACNFQSRRRGMGMEDCGDGSRGCAGGESRSEGESAAGILLRGCGRVGVEDFPEEI